MGPGFGLAVVSLTAVFRLGRAPMGWSEAAELFAAAYTAAVSVSLYLERYSPAPAPRTHRVIESLGAAVGFATVLVTVWMFASGRPLAEPALGLCSAIAAAALLVRRRTDRIRALVLALMAAAAFHWPPVSVRLPFISLSIFWGVLAVGCLIGDHPHRTAIRRFFSVGVLTNLVVAAFGAYALQVAYAVRSSLGLLLGGAMLMLGATGAVVIVLRGTWPERQARRRLAGRRRGAGSDACS